MVLRGDSQTAFVNPECGKSPDAGGGDVYVRVLVDVRKLTGVLGGPLSIDLLGDRGLDCLAGAAPRRGIHYQGVWRGGEGEGACETGAAYGHGSRRRFVSVRMVGEDVWENVIDAVDMFRCAYLD